MVRYDSERLSAVVIGDMETVRFFSLIGYEGCVASHEEFLDAVQRYVARDDIGLIVVTYDLLSGNEKEYFKLKMRLRRPLLVEVPSITNPDIGEVDYIELLRLATGTGG